MTDPLSRLKDLKEKPFDLRGIELFDASREGKKGVHFHFQREGERYTVTSTLGAATLTPQHVCQLLVLAKRAVNRAILEQKL
jgi:hypothetical protein